MFQPFVSVKMIWEIFGQFRIIIPTIVFTRKLSQQADGQTKKKSLT